MWRTVLPELLAHQAFRTQSELVDALRHDTGMQVDQSTVSRELRNLGVRKVDGVYRLPPPPSLGAPVHSLKVTANGCLAVVHTDPAHASVLGQSVDDAGVEGVLGTIAGDDTLFVALEGPRALASLRHLLGLARRRR